MSAVSFCGVSANGIFLMFFMERSVFSNAAKMVFVPLSMLPPMKTVPFERALASQIVVGWLSTRKVCWSMMEPLLSMRINRPSW